MTTASTSPSPPNAFEQDRRFVVSGIDWDGYQSALAAFGDRPVRLTYDAGVLELMSPSYQHERFRSLLGRFIDALTEELEIDVLTAGSTTFTREDVEGGLEPDNCYYIKSLPLLGDPASISLETDPPPDLVVEIEMTRSVINRLGLYASLGFPEIWRFDGKHLTVLLLNPQGRYEPHPRSSAFPQLPMEGLTRFLTNPRASDTRVVVEFRKWVRNGFAD